MEACPRVGEWEQKLGEWGEEAAERLNLDTFLNLIRESHSRIGFQYP
jgi:hypothetical protein